MCVVFVPIIAIYGQQQTGIVKTKGRKIGGQIVSGQGIPGVMINIKGRNTILSNNNGQFSFPVSGKLFQFIGITKNGYELIDQDACREYNIHFVIETHSEYLIRKLQLLVSGHVNGVNVDRSMVSIYYINSADDKSKQKVKKIEICSDGYLDDSFGEGFYDEATRLSRQLM